MSKQLINCLNIYEKALISVQGQIYCCEEAVMQWRELMDSERIILRSKYTDDADLLTAIYEIYFLRAKEAV